MRTRTEHANPMGWHGVAGGPTPEIVTVAECFATGPMPASRLRPGAQGCVPVGVVDGGRK